MKPEDPRREPSDPPAPANDGTHPAGASLWEETFSRENLVQALRRVERNRGAAGVDGTKASELRSWLHSHWPEVRRALDDGTYQPQATRRVTIPKPDGGKRLIRRYLEAGVMVDAIKQPTEQGTPQGSPLSPLLANVYLDNLDRELDRRGHRYVRYADDLVIYTRSKRAAERVMASVSVLIEDRLGLKVNRRKSAVDRATRRPLLSFGFFRREGEIKVRIDPKARERAKGKLRRITARSWGVSMERRIDATNGFIRGWVGYFQIADTPRPFEDLDEWLRRRLRQARWKQWKRIETKKRNLRALGIPAQKAHEWANTSKGPWRISGSPPLQRAMPNAYWRNHGLVGFTDSYRRRRDAERAARCGPACLVAW